MSLEERGESSIPQRYVLPPSQRPSPNVPISVVLPIIDMANLQEQSLQSQTIKEIGIACKEIGFFQVHIIDMLNLFQKKCMHTNFAADTI